MMIKVLLILGALLMSGCEFGTCEDVILEAQRLETETARQFRDIVRLQKELEVKESKIQELLAEKDRQQQKLNDMFN